MQKKIIALAIAAALTAPAMAFAEATVYGQVNLAVEMVNDGRTTGSTTTNQLNSYGSRFGLKGSEALDGGMSFVWQLEGGVNVDDGTMTGTQVFDRESHIGLTSASMGTVTAGLQASPYKAMSRRLDLFGDSVADTRTVLGAARILGGGHDISPQNAISYMTPSMGGFTVVAATVFGAESAQVRGGVADKKGSALGLAAMYDQGPIFAMLAIDNAKHGSPLSGQLGGVVDSTDDAFKVGGSYTMDAITVNAVYENIKTTTPAVEAKNTNLYLGGKFSVSSTDAVKLAYTKLGETKFSPGASATDGITQVALGYDHGMSKTTSVYALYTKVTQKAIGAANPSVLSVGIKHAF